MGPHAGVGGDMHIAVDKVETKFLPWQGVKGEEGQAKTLTWEHVFESVFLLQKSPIQRLILSPPTIPSQVTWVLLSTPAFCASSATALLWHRGRLSLISPCCDTPNAFTPGSASLLDAASRLKLF